jgi:hypothetical protein
MIFEGSEFDVKKEILIEELVNTSKFTEEFSLVVVLFTPSLALSGITDHIVQSFSEVCR